MGSFIIGYVGLTTYINPWLVLFASMALWGFSSVTDVIRAEERVRELNEDKNRLEDLLKLVNQIEKEMKETHDSTQVTD